MSESDYIQGAAASTGAIPKNSSPARRSREIVRTVLANKTMDEQCAIMDAMKDRKVYQETDVALDFGGYNLLSITDYITVVRYEIDQFMINKFWQCVSENRSVDIHGTILEWLGYENMNEYDRKATFIQLLKAHNIKYKQIKHDDPSFQNYPDLVEEAAYLSTNALNRKKWIIMGSRDFKKMVMCLRTNRADAIREYYLALEDLFKMYCEYTLYFQLKRAGNQIHELSEHMRLMRIDDEKARQQHEREREEDRIRFEAESAKRDQQYHHLKGQNDELLERNKQTQDVADATYEALQDVRQDAVPKSKRNNKMPKVGLVKKSPNYMPHGKDPEYFKTADITVIRRQTATFDRRVKEIRGYGAGTNADATLLWERDDPNAVNFYNRLTEIPGQPFDYNFVGITYREGASDELLLSTMDDAFNQKHQLPASKEEAKPGDRPLLRMI